MKAATIKKEESFKLSEIITHGRGGLQANNNPVCYSWHKKGNKSNPNSFAFCVFFTRKMLDEIRFREGDKVDVSYAAGVVTFNFNPENPFSVYKSSGTKFMMKVSTQGIERLMGVFPDTGKVEDIKVTSSRTGVITCAIA